MDDRTAVRVGFDLVGEVKVRKGDDEVGNCTFSSEAVDCPSLLGVPLGCCAFAVDDPTMAEPRITHLEPTTFKD